MPHRVNEVYATRKFVLAWTTLLRNLIDNNQASVLSLADTDGDTTVTVSTGLTDTDTIRLTTPAAGTVDVDSGTGGAHVDSTGTISLDAAAASNFSTSVGALTLAGVSLDIDATAGAATIDATAGVSIDGGAASNFSTSVGALTLAGVSLDIDASAGAATIDATAGVSIDGGAASNFSTSAGALTLSGTTNTIVTGATFTGGAIVDATPSPLTAANSGTTYSIAQSSAYAITLPPAAAGLNFRFVAIAIGNFAVTIGTDSGDNHLYGSVLDDTGAGTADLTAADADDSINLIANTLAIGDTVELWGIDATHWMVTARTTGNGGITITTVT